MKIRRHIAPLVALVAALAIGSSAACSADNDKPAQAGTGAQGTPAAQAPPVRHVDPKAFAETLKQPDVVVLDVRTPAEFAEGHLAKAVNLSLEAGDFAGQISELNTSATYAIYCRTGHRSGVAGEQMRNAGFTKIVDLQGGIVAWTAAGNKLVTK